MIEINREKPPETTTSRTTASVRDAQTGPDVTAGLEKGNTIEGTVVDRRGGFDIIDVAGQALKARSATPLPQGADVRLEVLKPGSPVQVRLLSILNNVPDNDAMQAGALNREMLNIRAGLAGMYSVFSRLFQAGTAVPSNAEGNIRPDTIEKALAFLLSGMEQGSEPDPARIRAMAAMFQRQGSSEAALLRQIMTVFRSSGGDSPAGTGGRSGTGNTYAGMAAPQGGISTSPSVQKGASPSGNTLNDTLSGTKADMASAASLAKSAGSVEDSSKPGGMPQPAGTSRQGFTPLFSDRNPGQQPVLDGQDVALSRTVAQVGKAGGGGVAGKTQNVSDHGGRSNAGQPLQQTTQGQIRTPYSGTSQAVNTQGGSSQPASSGFQGGQVQAGQAGNMVSSPSGSGGSVPAGSVTAGTQDVSQSGPAGKSPDPAQAQRSSATMSTASSVTAPSENSPGPKGPSGEFLFPGRSDSAQVSDLQNAVKLPETGKIPPDDQALKPSAMTARPGITGDIMRNTSPVQGDAGVETGRRSTVSGRMDTAPSVPGTAHHGEHVSAASRQGVFHEPGIMKFFNALASHGESVHQYQQQVQDFLNTPFFMVPLWFENGQGHGHWSWWTEDGEDQAVASSSVQHLAFDLELSNLGRVNIHILRDGQGISLHAAASRDILPVLRAGMQELRENLEAIGFSFSVADIFPMEEADVAELVSPVAGSGGAASSLNVVV